MEFEGSEGALWISSMMEIIKCWKMKEEGDYLKGIQRKCIDCATNLLEGNFDSFISGGKGEKNPKKTKQKKNQQQEVNKYI